MIIKIKDDLRINTTTVPSFDIQVLKTKIAKDGTKSTSWENAGYHGTLESALLRIPSYYIVSMDTEYTIKQLLEELKRIKEIIKTVKRERA